MSDASYRKLFSEIARKKSVRLNDLRGILRNGQGERTEAYLKSFTEANLVKELKSEVHGFNTYYITAAGLRASRKLGK